MIISLHKGHNLLIDLEDAHLYRGAKWGSTKTWYVNRGGYATRSVYVSSLNKKATYKTQSLHRLIMQPKEGEYIDHINGDKLDNRRKNLRIVTRSQNSWNQRPSKGRKYKGIFKTRYGNYQVKVGVYGQQYYFGTHKNIKEALHIYDSVAKQLHGFYARLNGSLG